MLLSWAHLTQHAFFRFIQSWKKELDNSGFVEQALRTLFLIEGAKYFKKGQL